MHPLLIEALLEDIFSDLIKKFPTQEAQLKQAKNEGVLPKYLPWLARMLASGSEEPIEDIIPVIKAFHQKQPALKAKFPDEPSVVDINSYKSVSDLSDKLESLTSIKYQSAPSDSDILFQDKRWLVAMPRTTTGSCELGKDTSWCTARTGSQNLFLSYVGRGKNIFLFYVIDKEGNPRSDPDAKLSIGFINGKPVFQGEYGGITVNANNAAVTQNQFQDIVGKDNADKFISLMTSKIKSSDGKHPAQEEMDVLSRDPILLKKKLDGFVNEEERIDFAKLILETNSVSPESLRVIISFDNEELNEIIARNPNCPPDILRKLSDKNYQDSRMFLVIVSNPNCPPDILRKLSDTIFDDVEEAIAKNPNCPLDVLEKLSDKNYQDSRMFLAIASNPNCSPDILRKLSDKNYQDSRIFVAIASNPNCPPDILRKLSDDPNIDVLVAVAENLNCPSHVLQKIGNHILQKSGNHILRKLDNDKIFDMKYAIASNPNCPPDILEKLSDDSNRKILEAVASNPNCPYDVQDKLSDHRLVAVRKAVAKNPNCSVYILRHLGSDNEADIVITVASNPNCPPDVLVKLSNDELYEIRQAVAENLNTPPDTLLKLGNDPDVSVQTAAKDNPNYPKPINESRFKAYIASFFNI